MADLIVEGDELVVRLRPLQKLAAFHGDVRVPLTAVRGVFAVEKPWLALRGRRMAGTALRGVAAMGTWIHGDRLYDFCVVRAQLKAVQVDLNAGRYSRLLVCVPDETDIQAEARRLAAAAGIAG